MSYAVKREFSLAVSDVGAPRRMVWSYGMPLSPSRSSATDRRRQPREAPARMAGRLHRDALDALGDAR